MDRWRRETVTIPLIEGDALAPVEIPALVSGPLAVLRGEAPAEGEA